MGGSQHFRRQSLGAGGLHDTIGNETSERFLIQMLELAAAAVPEMTTCRIDMVRPPFKRSIDQNPVARSGQGDVAAGRRYAIALGSDALDFFI